MSNSNSGNAAKPAQPTGNTNEQPQSGSQPRPGKKAKKQPTPPSPNGKTAKQSLPKVLYNIQPIEGTPYINDHDTAVLLIRSYFTPEVWVQQHLYMLLTDSWGKVLCIRRIGVGDFDSCIVDTRLIYDIAAAVRASNLYMGITRPTGFLDPGRIEDFIKLFDPLLGALNVSFEAFFVMGRDTEVEAVSEIPGLRKGQDPMATRYLI